MRARHLSVQSRREKTGDSTLANCNDGTVARIEVFEGVNNTARKQADETLLKAGALQRAIFNSANFSSIATDAKGVIQIFNVGAERMLGYTAAEVMNKITPADISDPQEVIARAKELSVELATPITPGFEALVFKASRGIEDIYELTYIRKDGTRFPAVVSVTALRDVQNAIIGYLLIGTDNTARKLAEETLLKAGALQRAIFNSANFSSIATDAKGVIQIFNVGAERMLGYTAAEVMNKITPADISDPQEVIARAKELSVELATPITPGFEALVFKASRGIEDIYELTYIRKDGTRFPAVVSVTALRDVQNAIIGYLLIGTDNTARKLVEAEQKKLDQRLAKSLEDLRAAQDRLIQTQKLASLGQLTAGIAHEMKNPLNFVNNFSALSVDLINELKELLDGLQIDDTRRAEITEMMGMLRGNLDKVVQHGKRADSIVKNMLMHSWRGSGEHRLVEINAIVDESLNLAFHGMRAERKDFNVDLKRSFDPAAGEVDVFPQELTRVLLNVISNGFYAVWQRQMAAVGQAFEPTLMAITVDLGDSVEIRIRDNGVGISAEAKELIFNPFFTTKPAGDGTGLGLSLSHDIVVKQHAGSIEVESVPGEFTEFKIILPRAAASIAKSEQSSTITGHGDSDTKQRALEDGAPTALTTSIELRRNAIDSKVGSFK